MKLVCPKCGQEVRGVLENMSFTSKDGQPGRYYEVEGIWPNRRYYVEGRCSHGKKDPSSLLGDPIRFELTKEQALTYDKDVRAARSGMRCVMGGRVLE